MFKLCIFQRQDGAFRQFRGSRAGLFSDLSTGESCPLRIVPEAGPAVSPTDKSRKHSALPPVTSEKSHPLWGGKIVRFCEVLLLQCVLGVYQKELKQ
jgi:hypothetical protein